MEIKQLENLVNEGLSIRSIMKKTRMSYSTIRYWLKKFNLKTKKIKNNNIKNDIKKCKICEWGL